MLRTQISDTLFVERPTGRHYRVNLDQQANFSNCSEQEYCVFHMLRFTFNLASMSSIDESG